MVFANGSPIQTVSGYFLGQYPFTPGLVHVWVEQGKRINGETLHPPAIDLHLADIEGLPGCHGITDQPFRLFPRGWIIGLPSNIDGQGIQPGLLPGDGFDQGRRRLLGKASDGRFSPHITLGRAKQADRAALKIFTAKYGDVITAAFRVESFTLFSSVLAPGGAVHTVEELHPLVNGTPPEQTE